MQNILDAALRPSTRRAYQRHWETFDRFCYSHLGIDAKLPADINHILLFLAYLHTTNRKHSTLQNYVSALSYRHKLADVLDTPSKFLIKIFPSWSEECFIEHNSPASNNLPNTTGHTSRTPLPSDVTL